MTSKKIPGDGTISMLRLTALIAILTVLLIGCTDQEDEGSGPGERTVPTPVSTESETPVPESTPTRTPELDDDMSTSEWFDLLATDKVYPEARTGEEVFELAESQDELKGLWRTFGFEESETPSEIDWDTTMVLFVGTGESGSCPIVLDTVEYDEDERLISVGTSRDVPADTMCTMDWTPRAFVIAMDRDVPGDGELRALVFDTEHEDQIDPHEAPVIREG
jgi:hypothetical protein